MPKALVYITTSLDSTEEVLKKLRRMRQRGRSICALWRLRHFSQGKERQCRQAQDSFG
jgi:hypothetical protein